MTVTEAQGATKIVNDQSNDGTTDTKQENLEDETQTKDDHIEKNPNASSDTAKENMMLPNNCGKNYDSCYTTQLLKQRLTIKVYSSVCSSLFAKHKKLFAFLLAFRINRARVSK